jgi:hypothetical protein
VAQKARLEQLFPAILLCSRLVGGEGPMRWWVCMLLVVLGTSAAMATDCPTRPRCHGCGCAGGPGYRAPPPDGHCVGFKELDKVCGNPPTTRCVFENAPHTGENRECALAPRRKQNKETGTPKEG